MINTLSTIISAFSIVDVIDIALISFVCYRLLLLMKGTRAVYMMISIFLLLILLRFSQLMELRVTSWILTNSATYIVLILVVVFQPEIRRALAYIGESRLFGSTTNLNAQVVDELVRSATILANRQIGALIIIQRNTVLTPYVQVGQKLDSLISRDLLLSIFIPYSPLHDGAVILENTRISYAGCILPLTKREDLAQMYGTRHRAAIGISEQADCIAIVVSEETGKISLALNGEITRDYTYATLKKKINEILESDKPSDNLKKIKAKNIITKAVKKK